RDIGGVEARKPVGRAAQPFYPLFLGEIDAIVAILRLFDIFEILAAFLAAPLQARYQRARLRNRNARIAHAVNDQDWRPFAIGVARRRYVSERRRTLGEIIGAERAQVTLVVIAHHRQVVNACPCDRAAPASSVTLRRARRRIATI